MCTPWVLYTTYNDYNQFTHHTLYKGLTYTTTEQILHRCNKQGSQAPRFNAAVVTWPLSCCGIATPVSFSMHLCNPLGVRSYRESHAVL